MNDYLSKPFTPEDLYQKLFKKLKIVPIAQPTPSEPQKVSFNLHYLKNMSGDNPEFVREMVETFINSIPKLLRDMEEALGKADLVKVGKIAHQIKPSLTLMGIPQLKESAVQLEEIVSAPHAKNPQQEVNNFIEACRKVVSELTDVRKTL